MTKTGLAPSVAAAALLISRAVLAQPQYTAQPDSPQWLKDRRYNEGVGIRTGDLELHPGIAGEVGYDSNWFLRTNEQGFTNGPPAAPIIPALVLRVTPSFYMSTLSAQRREGDLVATPPTVAFRMGVNATYRAFFGLSSDASQPQNDITKQDNIGIGSDARLDILPERPFGADIFGSYGRVIMPTYVTADPNFSFNRDDIGVGGEFVIQPGSGTLDWRLGYQFHDVIFEQTAGQPFDNTTNEAFMRGRWRFRPRDAFVYDGSIRWIQYQNPDQALNAGLVNGMPVRARLGLNGLITDRFAALLMAGWGASFYDTRLPRQPQYDSIIGQAELKWFLSASPGVAAASDLGLALSSIAVGYNRDFQNSYLGSFYGMDRGYLKFSYFFAGRALVTLEGGAGAVEYPVILWPDNSPRADPFTDVRVDATLFGEYRFTDSIGVNATLRYSQDISNQHIPVQEARPSPEFAMSWQRFEAYLGVRWFM
jgi:hypothetical protein